MKKNFSKFETLNLGNKRFTFILWGVKLYILDAINIIDIIHIFTEFVKTDDNFFSVQTKRLF